MARADHRRGLSIDEDAERVAIARKDGIDGRALIQLDGRVAGRDEV
jgi:2-hydroxychromene-2-carboxylate isomerase